MALPSVSAVLDGEVLIEGELLVNLSLEDLVQLELGGVLSNSAEEVGDVLAENLSLVEFVEDVEGFLGLCKKERKKGKKGILEKKLQGTLKWEQELKPSAEQGVMSV